jgi:hypothetical protein
MAVTQQELRRQAERLLELALQARERVEMELSYQLTIQAMRYFAEADGAADSSEPPPPALPSTPTVPQQQQQQQQQQQHKKPKDDGEKEKAASVDGLVPGQYRQGRWGQLSLWLADAVESRLRIVRAHRRLIRGVLR